MSLDNLFKAMSMFKDGMQRVQTTQAVNDANDQLSQLNSQEMSKQDHFEKAAQVGQSLALRLTAAGTDPARITAATSGLIPSASLESQNTANLSVEKMKTATQIQMEQEKAASNERIVGVKTGSAEDIAALKNQPATNKEVKLFGDQPQVKPILAGIPKIDAALDSIVENKGNFGITSVVELAKLGFIKNAAGRVNEKEILAANESPSARAQLWKEMNLQSTGETPANVQDFWQKLLEQSKANAYKQLHAYAEGHAASLKTMNPNIDANQISTAIHQRYGIPAPKANPNQASIDAAKAWLTIPENAASSDAMAVKTRIQQLEQGKP